MDIQLLFSEKDVRSLLSGQLSENLYAEFLGPAMYEAQEVYLAEFLGRRLLSDLKSLVAHTGDRNSGGFDQGFDESFSGGGAGKVYGDFLEIIKPYLIYKTMTRIIPKVALKVSNIGVHTSSDEKVQPASKEAWDTVIEDYDAMASKFLGDIQRYLREHCNEFTPAQRLGMKLGSSTITGLWLGGYVGRL